MGTCERTPLELANIIFTARARWKGVDYSALNRNCNHFSDELVFTLVGKHIHESINRLSDTASSAIGAIGEMLGSFVSTLAAVESLVGEQALRGQPGPQFEELPS